MPGRPTTCSVQRAAARRSTARGRGWGGLASPSSPPVRGSSLGASRSLSWLPSIDKQELVTPEKDLGVLLPQRLAHGTARVRRREELDRQLHLRIRRRAGKEQLV